MSKEKSNTPIKTIRLRGISAFIFENRTDRGTPFYKVVLVRTYKDGDQFKSTPTYSRDDIPILVHLANQAWDFVLLKERENRAETEPDID